MKKQSTEIAVLLDLWWIWVDQTLNEQSLDELQKQWLKECWLPVVYWELQIKKTRNADFKLRLGNTLHVATQKLEKHPMTQKISSAGRQHGENGLNKWS